MIGLKNDSVFGNMCPRKFFTELLKGIEKGIYKSLYLPNIRDIDIDNEYSIWWRNYDRRGFKPFDMDEIFGDKWLAVGSSTKVDINLQYDLLKYAIGQYYYKNETESGNIDKMMLERSQLYQVWWKNDPILFNPN